MKNIKRTLITVLAMLLVCVLSVSATLAYLYAKTATVRNTFSVGNVEITLDEAKVNKYGELLAKDGSIWDESKDLADRVDTNEYKLISGKDYIKDPTVHVAATSEESYIFIKLEISDVVSAVLVSDGANSINKQLEDNGWFPVEGTTDCYRYKETVDGIAKGKAIDLPIFKKIQVDEEATGDRLVAAKDGTIAITAYAIQQDGLENHADAWKALQEELAKVSS